MKNNRKIEVGQVRMLDFTGDTMYVITAFNRDDTTVKYITGEFKGATFTWCTSAVQNDIVVM